MPSIYLFRIFEYGVLSNKHFLSVGLCNIEVIIMESFSQSTEVLFTATTMVGEKIMISHVLRYLRSKGTAIPKFYMHQMIQNIVLNLFLFVFVTFYYN
jgi:hypothetical protein